ncbi:MAG: BMC domain-containing protein [Bacteroidetes bacterium]|nr:BMC domain-containing protein [Bacteroidota bacterium]
MTDSALGLIETRGLIAAIEAADAGLKAANVQLLARYKADAALVTVQFVGEVAAVKAAVEAGSQAAARIGTVISTHVIARPAPELFIELQKPDKRNLVVLGKDSTETKSDLTLADIEVLPVRELRTLARNYENLPIRGREISNANKEQLVEAFRKILKQESGDR